VFFIIVVGNTARFRNSRGIDLAGLRWTVFDAGALSIADDSDSARQNGVTVSVLHMDCGLASNIVIINQCGCFQIRLWPCLHVLESPCRLVHLAMCRGCLL
jgi:hypothetical protein